MNLNWNPFDLGGIELNVRHREDLNLKFFTRPYIFKDKPLHPSCCAWMEFLQYFPRLIFCGHSHFQMSEIPSDSD